MEAELDVEAGGVDDAAVLQQPDELGREVDEAGRSSRRMAIVPPTKGIIGALILPRSAIAWLSTTTPEPATLYVRDIR